MGGCGPPLAFMPCAVCYDYDEATPEQLEEAAKVVDKKLKEN